MSKQVKILLHLSKQDQEQFNYESADILRDFKSLMNQDFVLPITDSFRLELTEALRKDLQLPEGYLANYQATYKEDLILVVGD